MSIASRIQEIETHIGDVYDTINYSYDTTGINKNIINIPKYLKKGYIDIINNGIDTLYNNFPKVSEIGSNLSLTPTYEAPIKLNEIQGDTLQNGTPTPSSPVPIESVTGLQNVNITGKNLKDENNIFNGYLNDTEGIVSNNNNRITYIQIENNKTYNIKKVLSKRFRIGLTNSIPSNNLAINNYVSLDNQTSYTFTNTNYKYLCVWFWTNQDTLTEQQVLDSINIYTESNTYEVNLGKNLLPFTNQDFTFKDMHYYVQNGNIYLNGTNAGETGSNNALFKENFSFYLEAGTYTLQDKNLVSGNRDIRKYSDNTVLGRLNPNSKVVSFTLTERTQVYLGFYIYNQTYNNELIEVQLEKGSVATSYSPYFTPIELNKIGTYQDSIKKSTGKNLFDKNNITTGKRLYYWQGTAELIPDANYCVSDYINVNVNSTYTINLTMSPYTRMVFYDNNKNPISFNETNATFTTPNNTTYVRLSVPLNQLNTTQLEENSQATSYEPYGKVWYVEKQIGKVVLDGSNDENWRYQANYDLTNTKQFAWFSAVNTNSNIGLSNYFKRTEGWQTLTNTDEDMIQVYSDKSIYIRINNTLASDLATFKNWLSTHNTTVYYALATPTYTEITNTELINQLEELYTAKSQEGTTNISITSEDLEMILNVSALKGEE